MKPFIYLRSAVRSKYHRGDDFTRCYPVICVARKPPKPTKILPK